MSTALTLEDLLDLMASNKVLISSIAGTCVGLVLLRHYKGGGVCYSRKRLDGKTVIITGCNTGIGLETAKDLSARGAKVIMACRDVTKATAAAEKVKKFSGNQDVHIQRLDLASLESVKKFADRINDREKRIDILINNAGVMLCPYMKSEDGYEMQFAVNHLGHFLLTNLLLDRLKESAPSRIVNVSSRAHYRGKINFDDINSEKTYNAMTAYNQSKLANVLFTKELSQRLTGTGVTVNTLHPGVITTDLHRHVEDRIPILFRLLLIPFSFFMKTAYQGAQTSIFCAVDESLDNICGTYFSDCEEKSPSKAALVTEDAKRLWQVSEDLVAKATLAIK